jgi:hypothetical protein
MKEVRALQGFTHQGRKVLGDTFNVSDRHADALEKKGLVEVLGDGPTEENPSTAGGEKQSASPAAQASAKKTAAAQKGGEPKPKAGQSS